MHGSVCESACIPSLCGITCGSTPHELPSLIPCVVTAHVPAALLREDASVSRQEHSREVSRLMDALETMRASARAAEVCHSLAMFLRSLYYHSPNASELAFL